MVAIPQRRPLLLGGGAFQPPPGNVISNWRATGTGGSNGLPDGWTATTTGGVSFSVISRNRYRGSWAIEFQFIGTATMGGVLLVQPIQPVPAAPGQMWRHQVFAERLGVAPPADMELRMHWRNASNGFIAAAPSGLFSGALGGPPIDTGVALAPANTAFVGSYFYINASPGQVVALRYRVFAPVMWRAS